jgi:DivIVA domain-containing protein
VASQGQRFRRRALRRGYKVDEVDAFLDRVEATLNGETGAPITAQEVHDVVFRVRFGGYDEWQVDLHLDRVERQLGELEERGGFVPARGPERIGPGPMREDRMLPPVRDDRMAPPPMREERMLPPMRDDRPMPPPPPMAPPMRGQPPMPAPAGGGFGRFDDPRYDEPTGTFGGGGFDGFEPGRHGKMDMTTEIRMPADVGPPAGPPMGGGGVPGGGMAGGGMGSGELHRIDQLRRTFVPRRFGSGYDPAQVDRLFEGILQAMSSGRGGIPINDAELDPSQFNLVPGGYFEAEVDQALREVRDILLRRR